MVLSLPDYNSNQALKISMWFLRTPQTKENFWAWEKAMAMAGRNSTLNEIVTELLKKLFAPEKDALQPRILEIINKNAALIGNAAANGFRYKGEVYSNLSIGTRLGNNSNLHASLYNEMDLLLVEKKELDYDKARIKAGLIILLQTAYTDQDYRDALPNCLTSMIDRFRNLPRTREEAYTLKDDPQKMNQYRKVAPLIEYHSASRFLY